MICQLDHISPKQGSHFTCCTFWSKISINIYSCKGLVSQLDHTCLNNTMGHTIYVALLKAKFLLIYICGGLLCQHSIPIPKTRGHTFHVLLFLAIFDKYRVVKVWSVNWTLSVCPPQKSHIFPVALFWAKFPLIYGCEDLVSQLYVTSLSLQCWSERIHTTTPGTSH